MSKTKTEPKKVKFGNACLRLFDADYNFLLGLPVDDSLYISDGTFMIDTEALEGTEFMLDILNALETFGRASWKFEYGTAFEIEPTETPKQIIQEAEAADLKLVDVRSIAVYNRDEMHRLCLLDGQVVFFKESLIQLAEKTCTQIYGYGLEKPYLLRGLNMSGETHTYGVLMPISQRWSENLLGWLSESLRDVSGVPNA